MSGWFKKLNGFLKDSVTALQVQRDFFVVYDYAGKGIQKEDWRVSPCNFQRFQV